MARTPDLARRKEIISRAFSVLRERGVHDTTMSDLARALGMKRPTLYWYVKDLGELFDHAFEEIQAQFLGEVQAKALAADGPIALLESILETAIRFHKENRDLIVLLFQLWAVGRSRDPEAFLRKNRELVEPFRQHLHTLFEAGVTAGEVAPCDPRGVVDLFLIVLDGLLVQRVIQETDLGPALRTFRAFFFDRLRASHRPSTPDGSPAEPVAT